MCVIFVLCAGGSGMGSGQPAQRRRSSRGELESKREDEIYHKNSLAFDINSANCQCELGVCTICCDLVG